MKKQTELAMQKSKPMVFPLAAASQGQRLRLIEIDAGKQLTHRLTELGLTLGVELMIVHDSGGPLVLSVRGSRVAIGRGMASKMRVMAVQGL
jgi:Fe2+ transport system protein FeoA